MRLRLTPEEVAFRQDMRTFFTTKIPERTRDRVAAGRHLEKAEIVEAHQLMNEAGLAVPNWPVEWGGRAWTPLQRHLWHEEMQLAAVPPPYPFNVQMIGPVIAQFGSEEMKARFLPATANLDIWWCQGFSEPNAGSDLASLTTRAERDGEDWIVNGQKTWTTLAQHADWIFCLVRTDPAVKKQAGITMILFPMSSPGVTIRPIQMIDGAFEVNEVFFDDVRVSGENVVGELNQGWTQAKFLLGNERVGVAPVAASKRTLASIKQIAADQGRLSDILLAARIAELENELLALELTALRVVANSSDGKADPAPSILKLKGTELQQAVAELQVDVAGELSLASGSDAVPEWAALATPKYLNLRKASIYGGSNEIQRQIIAGTILGL